jgi:anti-sigma regulatory factor (Ser/Thr protein kinase)
MLELHRHFLSDPRLVSEMRSFVSESLRQVWTAPDDEKRVYELQLAVSEVGSNIILHGCEGRPDENIDMGVTADSNQVCVEFRYHGCEFRPAMVAPPDFESRAESGYGQYLISQTVDSFEYCRDENGICCIRLIKHRPQTQIAPPT